MAPTLQRCTAILASTMVLGCGPASSPDSVTKLNAQGFEERTFDNGHVFVRIPAGSFSMGTTGGEAKELPIHEVHLDEFWIGKYPVTVVQFSEFADATGYVSDAEKGEGCWIESGGGIRYDVSWRKPNFEQPSDHPVICVSWNDAMAYADWFAEKHDIDATLPTEAQWEKAARGNDQRTWPWGNEVPDGIQANFADVNYQALFGDGQRTIDAGIDDGHGQTSPVDAYPAGQSPYGVFDMAGNAIDWLYDWYDIGYYASSPTKNPIGPDRDPVRIKSELSGGWTDNLQRSIRGGAWTDASGVRSLAEAGHSIRSDMRERTDQYSSDDHLSFRLAIDERERHAAFRPTNTAKSTAATAAASVMETVGTASIEIHYDRLQVAGREARTFGFEIPHGEFWSPGDVARTRVSVSEDVQIHDQTLPAGDYTLFMTPESIPEGGGTWEIIFTRPETRAFREMLRLRTRAQLEDNSKGQLEYFFDEREGIRILRFLFDFVEVHIPFDRSDRGAGETASASVMNAMGDTSVTVSYRREVIADGSPGFGKEVAFDQPWDGGESRIEFSRDLLVNGEPVAAGVYALSYVPRRDAAWAVRLTPEGGLPGNSRRRSNWASPGRPG